MNQFYNNLKTILLLGLLTGLILAGGALIGGQQGLTFALITAAGMNLVGYFFSDQIALASAGAQEVGPDHPLYGIIERLAERAELPMPRVYVSPQAAPNAFATGRNPQHAAVCATQGLLDMLDENEIAGVLSHELAHVKHRDILITSVAATIAAAISYLGYMLMWGGSRSRDEGSGLEGLLFLILSPLAALLIQAGISRSREFNADAGGAQICGNPMWLATALEKIHAGNSRIPMETNPAFNGMYIAEPLNAMGGSIGSSLAGLFQTHPPLESRLMNLIGRPSTGIFRHAA
jgi:heat shock protein HtpX